MASQALKDARFFIGNKQYERLVLITEPKILQVSLVNISDNFTVRTRVSVFKHPLIVHPIDAHYFNNRVLLADIGRTENGITI